MEAHFSHDPSTELLRGIAKRTPVLTLAQEYELAQQIKGGSRTALDHLLRAHLRLVLTMARELKDGSCAPEDLISEGLVGLVLAADRFEPERGRFANYASYWIRACIFSFRRRNRRAVQAPTTRHARTLLSQLPRFSRAYFQERCEDPDAEAVARAFELDVAEASELLAGLFSRDVAYDPSELDLAADVPTPEATFADSEAAGLARERLHKALAQLSDREREIIERRHLTDDAPSLRDVGREYGVSGERVRQIDSAARERLRELLS
jgi:RNA polymerase sigma-32 factor